MYNQVNIKDWIKHFSPKLIPRTALPKVHKVIVAEIALAKAYWRRS